MKLLLAVDVPEWGREDSPRLNQFRRSQIGTILKNVAERVYNGGEGETTFECPLGRDGDIAAVAYSFEYEEEAADAA